MYTNPWISYTKICNYGAKRRKTVVEMWCGDKKWKNVSHKALCPRVASKPPCCIASQLSSLASALLMLNSHTHVLFSPRSNTSELAGFIFYLPIWLVCFTNIAVSTHKLLGKLFLNTRVILMKDEHWQGHSVAKMKMYNHYRDLFFY